MNGSIGRGLLEHLKPTGDRMVLMRLPDTSKSNLIIPEIAQQPAHRGKVVRLGPGRLFKDGSGKRPISVPMGAVVQYQSCDFDDGEYVLIEEGDVLFIEQ